MEWANFLKISSKLPIISREILLAGSPDASSLEVQLSRWKKAGKIIQLKRGYYMLSEPYGKIEIYEPFVAAVLKRPSYISLEKALEYYNLIPEAVTVYTSVTTKRNARFESEVGIFDYKHIKQSLFWGYNAVTVNKQTAFFASPEKTLLDFFYLKKIVASPDYLHEMRLQNLKKINFKTLFAFARRFNKPKLMSVARMIEEYALLDINGDEVV